MTSYGYDVEILQSYQPTQTGARTNDAIYFSEVDTERIGHPQRLSAWDLLQGKMVSTDFQQTAITYQASTLVRSPKDYTPSDILNDLALYMNSAEFIDALESNGIRIFKIGNIRANWYKDDRDQHQNNPNFDFTLIYNRTIIRDDKAVSDIDYIIKGV